MTIKHTRGETLPPVMKVPPRWVDSRAFWASLPRKLRVVQLGVYWGHSASELREVLQPEELHLIDFWKPYGVPRIKALEPQERWDKRYRTVQEKFAGCAGVNILRRSFGEACPLFANMSVDVIYHDGDATEAHARETLSDWWRTLKPGGLFMGTGFAVIIDNGVIPAVVEFSSRPDVEFMGITRCDSPPCYVLKKGRAHDE